MKLQTRLLFLLVTTICQSCGMLPHQKPLSVLPLNHELKHELKEQRQVFNLFVQGMKFQALSPEQQKLECNILKKSYQQDLEWHAGWLLVFLSGDKFTCIELSEKLEIMKSMAKTKNQLLPLDWLNKNQIYLLNTIRDVSRENVRLKDDLNKVNVNLSKVNVNLNEINSKIDALKAIENGINEKLDRPQENEK